MTRENLEAAYGRRTVRALSDLLGYCGEAARVVELGEARLREDWLVQRAVEGILNRIGTTIGEQLSSDFRDAHPSVPWSDYVAQRVLVIHAYRRIDWGIVWGTLVSDLPQLAGYVGPLLASEHPQ